MSTPFKMKPGRGNMLKTGRGISPVLMSKSPMKQEAELTAKGAKSRKEAQKSASKNTKIESQGVNIDPKSGKGSAASYEKKFIPGSPDKGVRAKIIDGSGKLVKEAKSGEDDKLKKEFERNKAVTAKSRERNTRQFNVQTGSAKPNAKEVEAGKNRGFYKK